MTRKRKEAPPEWRFDYDGPRRGYWATLRDQTEGEHTVVLTEYPGTLVAMARAGVLTGAAAADAAHLIAEAEGAVHGDHCER